MQTLPRYGQSCSRYGFCRSDKPAVDAPLCSTTASRGSHFPSRRLASTWKMAARTVSSYLRRSSLLEASSPEWSSGAGIMSNEIQNERPPTAARPALGGCLRISV